MKTRHSGNSGKIETVKNAIVAAINGAKKLGVSAENAAAATASGTLKGPGEISSTALVTICKALTKTIHGVKVLAKEPEVALFSNN